MCQNKLFSLSLSLSLCGISHEKNDFMIKAFYD